MKIFSKVFLMAATLLIAGFFAFEVFASCQEYGQNPYAGFWIKGKKKILSSNDLLIGKFAYAQHESDWENLVWVQTKESRKREIPYDIYTWTVGWIEICYDPNSGDYDYHWVEGEYETKTRKDYIEKGSSGGRKNSP